ncbi:transcriptional regulator [Streptomyces varsoviensis]|uniref:transcriptional regulator n=1 Tax=Streptomyces varsoviensis TaxID=67373 RepID=UPI0033E642A0
MSAPGAESRLDAVIQHPTKLAVVSFLSACAEAEFKTVWQRLGLTDSALSKTVSALESAGYVAVRKGFVGKRARTWVALTPHGRKRLVEHLEALRTIAGRASELGEGAGPA